MAGGGKDSSLMLELLKKSPEPHKRACVLGSIRSAVGSVKVAGYEAPIVVNRIIDPKLMELNKEGYLNGHTPFSAYLGFVGMAVAALHGYSKVIVANESSANQASLTYHGLEINHQYSKSYRFEKAFRHYAQKFLWENGEYFSFLRPLNDLQVSMLFSKCKKHHANFRSCNVGQKKDIWCGECPKCAFVYLSLYPFMTSKELLSIFGADFSQHPSIELELSRILGIKDHKPFECVGTIEEARAALILAGEKHKRERTKSPAAFQRLSDEIRLIERANLGGAQALLNHWNKEHFLPARYAKLLHEEVLKVS